MTVRGTSLVALEENKISLGHDQQIVYELLIEMGPMSDNQMLETLRFREMGKPRDLQHKWEKSDITGRRNQLVNKGAVQDLGAYFGWVDFPNGRRRIKKHHFWAVNYESKPIPFGWYETIEEVPGAKRKNIANRTQNIEVKKETLF